MTIDIVTALISRVPDCPATIHDRTVKTHQDEDMEALMIDMNDRTVIKIEALSDQLHSPTRWPS